MRFLITGTYIDIEASVSPQKSIEIVEQMVIPSLEALAQLEKERKILAGGIRIGARSLSCIVEAASNEEVSDLLRSLPFWIMIDWVVIPLEGFAHRLEQDRKMLQNYKAAIR